LISMGVDVDNLAMKILSFIPFTSPMAMFTRIAMSTVAWYEIAISIGLLIITTLLIGIFTAKVYRIGVLLYGTPPKPKALWKALRRA
jgi:ABC-2 type transport system permease protein